MQCPLCRESVADDNALQVHYLMSCRGYLDSSASTPPSKKLVQFRWVKSKPTLAREVYLISSLAGSVKLDWRTIDECFLSGQVDVPQGLHVCQLIVDEDAMSTDDFTVSETSRTIDILISKVPQDSTGNINSDGENDKVETQPVSRPDRTNEQEGRSEVTTQQLPEKGSLYSELLEHHILHGDSLETLTGGSSGAPEGSRERMRTRGNGVATRTSRGQRSAQDKGLSRVTRTDDGDHTERTQHNISDRLSQSERNEVLQDSLGSDELRQFLQPTRTRQESNGDVGEVESSLSDNEEHSVSLSSHDGFERRPELLGQSNGENESRVEPDTTGQGVSDEVPVAGSRTGNHEESVSDHRQETRLIDFSEPSSWGDRETSSNGRNQSGDDRERASNDQQGMPKADRRLPFDDDRRESSGNLREESTVSDRQRPSDEPRERPSSGHGETSSGVRRGQTLGDGREPSEDNRVPSEGSRETLGNSREDSINDRGSSGDNRKRSENNHLQDNSEPSNGDREQSSKPRTEASGHHREETSSGVQENSGNGFDPKSFDGQERTSRRERTSGSDRHKPAYLEAISGSPSNNSTRNNRTSFLNDSDFQSLPATFSSDHNTRSTVQSGLFSGDLISPRGSDTVLTDSHVLHSQTRGRISPRSSATTVTTATSRVLDTGDTFTGGRRLEGTTDGTTTDDLLFRNHSTGNSGSRTNAVLAKDTKSQGKGFGARRRHSSPTNETSARSRNTSLTRDIPQTTDTPQTTDIPRSRDVTAPSRDMSTSSREAAQSRESHQSKDITPQSRDITSQSRDITPQSRESRQSSDITTPSTDAITLTRDRNPLSIGSRTEQSPTNISGNDNSPTLTRRSPQGSFMDSDIRRPPLYTSAPSRPHSSLPYTSHTAISHLSSPRDGVSAESLGTSATTQSRLDRIAPAGYTVSPGGVQATTVPPATTSKQFQEDHIKELLESLKESASKRGVSPESTPRERPGASELTSFKQKLAERDETVKRLKEKNARYKASNDELREKVIGLTKDLSLAEGSRNTLREQEEISSELENALGEKELECSQLKEQVFEVEREQRRMAIKFDEEKKNYEKKIHDLRKIHNSLEQEVSKKALREQEQISSELENALGEKELECSQLKEQVFEVERKQRRMAIKFDEEKKDYEKKIHDLRKVHNSLEQEVKTLRDKSRLRNTSPKSSREYKKTLEQFQESLAISASLQDQVETLQKENNELKEKIKNLSPRSREENLTSYTRDLYPFRSALGASRQDYSSINGYPETETSRRRIENDRYLTSNVRHAYDGHQPVIENSRYNIPGGTSRTNLSRPQSEALQDRLGSPRDRSEILSRPERSRSRESRSRQRFTTADNVSPGTSDPVYRQLLQKRSHSSDSIRNAFPDGSRSRVSPSQERGSQELDRRSKHELRHSGSYGNLYTRPTSSSPPRDLTLTGPTATSPDTTSPRSKQRSSPGKGSPFAPDTPQELDLGMTVLVSRHRGKLSRGVVKYVGYLPDKEDKVYVGLELHDGDGKHDGRFNGQRFFKCQPNRGVFVLFEKIVMAYT